MTAFDKIESGSFAEACYNENSIAELQVAINESDKTDMAEWELTESEYRAQIKIALTALIEDENE